MKKYKFIFLLIFYCSAINVSSQKLSFSNDILNKNDNEVKEISTLWKNYVESYSAYHKKQTSHYSNDSSLLKYWNKEELSKGTGDMLEYSTLGSRIPMYIIGEHYTFDIRKLNDEFYEIFTQLRLNKDSIDETTLMIYRVCAKKENGKYKLYNAFFPEKQVLKSLKTESINYYYPYSYIMDKSKLKETKNTIKKFEEIQKAYQIKLEAPIIYIVANSFDECDRILGMPYTVFRNYYKYTGMTISPNVILSCTPDHLHEMVHTLFMPTYPNATGLFQEGIATYYGGSNGKNFKENINLLKEYLNENPNTDLADVDSYQVLWKDGFNPMYAVGALLIEEALKIGGTTKVLDLFQYSSEDEAIEKVFNISKNEINPFIKNLVYLK